MRFLKYHHTNLSCMLSRTCNRMHRYMCVRAHVHVHVHVCVYTLINAHSHVHVHTLVHTQHSLHTHTHTHSHSHIHTHTHTLTLTHTQSYIIISANLCTHTHTLTGPEPSAVDPSLHQPDTQLLDKLRDVYVESTTNVITVSVLAKLVSQCSLGL